VATPPKTYRELCGLLMPRKIHNVAELEAAQEMINVLAVLPTRTPDQDDYLQSESPKSQLLYHMDKAYLTEQYILQSMISTVFPQ